jgi:hypothetical protein
VLDGQALGAADLGPRLPAGADAGGTVSDRRRARVPAGRQPALLRMAERCCTALQVEGPALVELVVSDSKNEVVRGVDVAPLLTPTSLYGRIAATAGISFADVVEFVLQGARLRNRGRLFDGDAHARHVPLGDGRAAALSADGTCALPH